MRNNDQSNRIIKWIVTVGDFVLLNAILLGFAHWHWRMGTWQMEGRVKRDIWYMEHWSIWLDIRIVWLTIKSIFIHDEHAY